MGKHGRLTAEIGQNLEFNDYDVFYDHGSKSKNVGKIVSTLIEKYKREDILSQLDIAIVEKSSKRVIVLIELEETNAKPKTLLGDVFGTLMGEHIYFGKNQKLLVGEYTSLIVLGNSKSSEHKNKAAYEVRNKDLQTKLNKIKPTLSTGNSKLGEVVIESVPDATKLEEILIVKIDIACKRAKKFL